MLPSMYTNEMRSECRRRRAKAYIPVIGFLLMLLNLSASAQEHDSLKIGVDRLDVIQSSVTIESFDNDTSWLAEPLNDAELINVMLRYFPGKPDSTISGEMINESMMLGMKLVFLDVSNFEIHLYPKTPIFIGPGTLLAFSSWVYGMNIPHKLYVEILDPDREPLGRLYMGKLSYVGWKQIHVSVPSLPAKSGLYFNGFILVCGAMDIYSEAVYYYFDTIEAVLVESAE